MFSPYKGLLPAALIVPEDPPAAPLLLISAKAAGCYFFFTGSPVNRSMLSNKLIWSFTLFLPFESLFIPQSSLHFFLLYLHNSPYTKSACFHTCILNEHVCQISLVNFFPLDIQLYPTLYIFAVFL